MWRTVCQIFLQGDVDSISNCLDYKQGGNTVGKRGLKWLIANNINFQEGKRTNTVNENDCLFLVTHMFTLNLPPVVVNLELCAILYLSLIC
jgi:hypothetical protein